jgi:hypothetical protein
MFNVTVVCGQAVKDASYYKSKGYQVFSEFGFAVKCPKSLEDISSQMRAENDISYGCILNDNSRDKLVMYQVLVKKIPVGYLQASAAEKEKVEEQFFSSFSGEKKRVIFNNLNAVVVSFIGKEDITGKAIIFIRNGATYSFNLMTNDGLEQKFNLLTNNIKFF